MTDIIKELRKYRIGGLAIFDLVFAIIGMVLLAGWLGYKEYRWYAGLAAVPIGIIVHRLFGIKTTLNYKLGLSEKPE
jgi:uncharacterized membrane protein YqjE